MRVDFVGHATLLVRQGGLTVLTDPWWTGPAYRGQWYPYPLPVPERYDLAAVDAVYISHAHEDHLHRGTLSALLAVAPEAAAVIPERYDTRMADYLRRIGFRRIREVPSGSTITLRKGEDEARLTVLTHMDDSMLAVEAGGEVLLDANDALHASRREIIEEYCRLLRRRFPRLNYLFCGFGGASYFPNCFQVPGKDDEAVARAREEFFLHNFALVAARLQPRIAVPFAAHFILPGERTWWISRSRLAMEPPAETARRLLAGTPSQVHDLQPGDSVEEGVVHASPYPRDLDPDAVRREVLAAYPTGRSEKPLDAAGFAALVGDVRTRVLSAPPGEPLDAAIALWDYPDAAIRVRVGTGSADVEAVGAREIEDAQPEVVLETRSDLVRSTMQSSFGVDLITIGYAALVRLRSPAAMARSDHERLLRLLTPRSPRWRERLRHHPGRALGFILGDPSMRYELKMRLGVARGTGRRSDEPSLYGITDWATLVRAPES